MGLFKKTTEADKLRKQHARILKEAFELSKIDRKQSDALYAKADGIMDRITELEGTSSGEQK